MQVCEVWIEVRETGLGAGATREPVTTCELPCLSHAPCELLAPKTDHTYVGGQGSSILSKCCGYLSDCACISTYLYSRLLSVSLKHRYTRGRLYRKHGAVGCPEDSRAPVTLTAEMM